MRSYEAALAGLTENANAIRHASIPEEDWALVANHLRVIEVDLATKRREIEQDATDLASATRKANPDARKTVYESERGKLVEQVKRTRSFNSSGWLAAVMKAGYTIGEAIQTLVKSNGLELKWKITGLENVADRLGIDYQTAHHEITDGDPDYLVGVVSTSKMVRA